MNKNLSELYLASGSASRKMLLTEAKIPFKLLSQSADETLCDWSLPLEKLVESIAVYKMEHVILPAGKEGEKIFVITSDTLTIDGNGKIAGKPSSREEVVERLRSYRKNAITGTAFCLDTKLFKNGKWVVENRQAGYALAEYVFDIPDHLIDWYLDECFEGYTFMDVSGGVIVDGAGSQFLKKINGSYTAVLGLPMYELRMALEKLK